MKKFIKNIVVVLVLINFALIINTSVAIANNHLAPSQDGSVFRPLEFIKSVGKDTKLPDFDASGQHPDSSGAIEPGASTVVSPLYFVVDILRYAISTIAFIVVIIAAARLISTSTEEEATKSKNTLMLGLLGLILINLADVIVKKMFFGEQGEAFEDLGTAKLFAEDSVSQIRGIIGFVELFVGAVAVLVLVIRGFVLVTSGGDEEKLTAAKKHVMFALLGLVIVGLAEIVVRGVIFPEAGSELPNVALGKLLLVKITNYLSGFIAIISFLVLLSSGYRYVISGGEEEVKEKVKKTFFAAVIGLVLAMGAFALVNTVITLDETIGPDAPPSSNP